MKTRFKKGGLLAVSILMTGCSTGVSYLTPPIECRLVDSYAGEYEAGKPIDTEWFFYCSDRRQASVSVEYTKNKAKVSEEIIGTVYYPKVTGTHVFTMKCKDVTLTKEIEVLDEQPILTIDKTAYFTGVASEIYFFDIYNEISITQIPSYADLIVDKVEWSPFDFTLGGSEPTFTEVPFTQRYFDGSKQGKYKISLSLVNGKRSAHGEINAYITNKERDGNENILVMEDGKYASNKAVVDPTNKNNFILPSAPFNSASYIVLANPYENDKELGIRFKGKQIPSFGLFVQPNATNGSFSPFSIDEGYVLSFSERATNTYTVYGYSQEWKRAYQSQYEFAIDNLDNNKYYYFKWSFMTTVSADPKYDYLHNVRWFFYEIENYGTSSETLKKVFEIDGAGGWFDNHNVPPSYMSIYGSSLQDVTFELVL